NMYTFGGPVEDRGPRELTAVFGLGSIEDAPRRAAHAAMAILKAAERAQDEGDNSRVKLVIHVAQVLVARAGATTTIHAEAVSDSAAACKRLLASGEDATIVVTDAAAPFLHRHFPPVPLPAASDMTPAGGSPLA